MKMNTFYVCIVTTNQTLDYITAFAIAGINELANLCIIQQL